MFTGITQGMGTVAQIDEQQALRTLSIQLDANLCAKVALGASVAVNGTCLTVTDIQPNLLRFDVIAQTLELTNLGLLKSGDKVNIERSLKMGDELGGHIVSGHVSQTVEVLAIDQFGDNTRLWMAIPDAHQKHILPQGFIGLNGCSLTIANVMDDRFSVCLIPETLRTTTFGEVSVGDMINMEIDKQTQTIVATVERVLAYQQSQLSQ